MAVPYVCVGIEDAVDCAVDDLKLVATWKNQTIPVPPLPRLSRSSHDAESHSVCVRVCRCVCVCRERR